MTLQEIFLPKFLQFNSIPLSPEFKRRPTPNHVIRLIDETQKTTCAKYKFIRILEDRVNDSFGNAIKYYIYKLDGRSVRYSKCKVII